MTDKSEKPAHLHEVPKLDPLSIFDDLEALKKMTPPTVHRREVVTVVGVDKPGGVGYFRTNTDPAMMFTARVFKYELGRDKTTLYVTPRMESHPLLARGIRRVLLTVVQSWPARTLTLWPVPDPSIEQTNSWNVSAIEAYKLSKTKWVQMVSGDDRYIVHEAEGELPPPEWPEKLSFNDLLKIAFKEKIIFDDDDPWMKKLRGVE
jgi:hypothetical protein